MAKRRTLDPLRDQLKVLVDIANEKANYLIDNNIKSRALLEAQRTLKKQYTRNDEMLFDSNLKSRRMINREFARVQAFLNDYTSSAQGAENFESDLTRLKGAFGAKWSSTTGENYDTSRIDKDVVNETFDLYRRVVESAGGWERAVGLFQGKESLIGYGSENLIAAIYDMVENDFDRSEIMNRARDMVETGIAAYAEMARRQVSNYDYGIVFDDETATARRNFYVWRRQYRDRNRG